MIWTEFTSRERLRSPPRSGTPTLYASMRVILQTQKDCTLTSKPNGPGAKNDQRIKN